MNNIKFPVIKSRMEMELSNIFKLQDELKTRGLLENTQIRKVNLSDEFILRAVGSILHDFYTSAENMFKIVARYIDESLPDNSEWHIELLQQMSIRISDVPPELISHQALDLLNEYRSFRHVFRNIRI